MIIKVEASDRAGVRVGRSLPARGVPALCGLAFLPKAKAAGEAHAYARYVVSSVMCRVLAVAVVAV